MAAGPFASPKVSVPPAILRVGMIEEKEVISITGKARIEVWQGNITKCSVDAIVNAANSSLLGGGGVDGAIHRAGGPEILEACRALRAAHLGGGLPVGQAVATTAGRLDARWVIHTVGPVYSQAEDRSELLASAYRECLRVADELETTSIAFPTISAGVYGWPMDSATRVAVETIRNTNQSGPCHPRWVHRCRSRWLQCGSRRWGKRSSVGAHGMGVPLRYFRHPTRWSRTGVREHSPDHGSVATLDQRNGDAFWQQPVAQLCGQRPSDRALRGCPAPHDLAFIMRPWTSAG